MSPGGRSGARAMLLIGTALVAGASLIAQTAQADDLRGALGQRRKLGDGNR